jgi:hypothetical protein
MKDQRDRKNRRRGLLREGKSEYRNKVKEDSFASWECHRIFKGFTVPMEWHYSSIWFAGMERRIFGEIL